MFRIVMAILLLGSSGAFLWWANEPVMRVLALIMAAVALVIFLTGRSGRESKERAAKAKLQNLGSNVALDYEEAKPLTDDDRRALHREYRSLLVVLALFSLVPLSFLFFIDEESRIYLYMFTGFWILIMILFGARANTKRNEILEAGTKNVLRGIVTARFHKEYTRRSNHTHEQETTSIPHLKIGDRELWVSHKIFGKYDVGDAIELHYCSTGVIFETPSNVFLADMKIEGAGVMD